MSKRMYQTFTSWVWESDEPDTDPTIDSGFWDETWGKCSTEGLTIGQFQDERDSVAIDFYLDEYDIEDGLTLAMKVAQWLWKEGLTAETGADWYSCEPYCANYATGESLEISAHFVHDDWTDAERNEVDEELNFIIANHKAKMAQSYFDSVKAIV